MAVITITEAAKKWNCGRATIYRKLNSGELSGTDLPDGGRGVDTSELHRVFGMARPADGAAVTLDKEAGRDLIRENTHLRELLEAKDEHIETLKQAMRLLEDKRPPSASPQIDETATVLAAVMERKMAEAEDLQDELSKARQETAELEAALQAERSRGVWSRLFGRRS